MWEWRVFWCLPADGGEFDLWRAMKLGDWRVDTRVDTYLVATADVGVKLRRGREVEVKVRVAREEESGAEKWTKLYGGK